MRTIRVTGKGQIRLRPDMTRITMKLSGLSADYAETLRESSEQTEELKDVLSGFGFERSDLKTLSFSVDTEYESYRGKNNEYRQRFLGYRFDHSLKVEFESDNERLGKILYALAHSGVCPEFRISYTVKDPEAAKNLLLGKAVTDAREKAAVLTQAGGRRARGDPEHRLLLGRDRLRVPPDEGRHDAGLLHGARGQELRSGHRAGRHRDLRHRDGDLGDRVTDAEARAKARASSRPRGLAAASSGLRLGLFCPEKGKNRFSVFPAALRMLYCTGTRKPIET